MSLQFGIIYLLMSFFILPIVFAVVYLIYDFIIDMKTTYKRDE